MRSKFPLAVEIEINTHCNLSCPYCPNSKFKRVENGHMDESLFALILTQLRSFDYAGRISYHFYNEPTLSPNLEKFTLMTREYLPKARIDLYTNGTLLEKNNIPSLSQNGVDRFTVTRHIKGDTPKMDEALSFVESEVSEKFQVRSFKEIELSNRGGSLNLKLKNVKPPLSLPCFIPRSVLVITVLGNVVPCYEDYFQKHVMGNVKDAHLLDIWNSARYADFREALQQGKRSEFEVCKDCNNRKVLS